MELFLELLFGFVDPRPVLRERAEPPDRAEPEREEFDVDEPRLLGLVVAISRQRLQARCDSLVYGPPGVGRHRAARYQRTQPVEELNTTGTIIGRRRVRWLTNEPIDLRTMRRTSSGDTLPAPSAV